MANSNDITIGKEGWIFLTGGSNSPLETYSSNEENPSYVRSWVKLIDKRVKKIGDLGAEYIHLFAPNKLSIYPEYFPAKLPFFSNHPISSVVRSINQNNEGISDNIVNPIPFFNKQKKNFPLYWKTDSHWNFQGCFCAYQLICSRLGVKPNNSLLSRPVVQGKLSMDLGSKLSPPEKEHVKFYNTMKDSNRVYANRLVNYKEDNKLTNEIGLHIGSHVIFVNKVTKNRKKLLLFGDSFSEYRPNLLTGMLAETFSEVHFIWSNNVDYSYIRDISPDIVITELAERFMTRVPTDKFSLKRYVDDLSI